MAARLRRDDLHPDPIEQFRRWFDDARHAGQAEPEAMAVATVGSDGTPSVRFVLMRGLDQRGFAFYTNRRSRKAEELAVTPMAAAVFRWKVVERQVRVVGAVEAVDEAEADAYFAGRPRGSQLAAWSSDQSEVVADREALEARFAATAVRFEGSEVNRPPWWGGYRIRPSEVEFWQEGDSRLHDRFVYTPAGTGGWAIARLAP